MSKTRQRFSPKVRERTVRLVREARGKHASEWATICAIEEKLGCTVETLRSRLRRDRSATPGCTRGRSMPRCVQRVARLNASGVMSAMSSP